MEESLHWITLPPAAKLINVPESLRGGFAAGAGAISEPGEVEWGSWVGGGWISLNLFQEVGKALGEGAQRRNASRECYSQTNPSERSITAHL